MIGTTSPETAEAERPADAPPREEVAGGLGDVTFAVVAVVLPFLFALYAVLTTGKALEGRWKFALVGGFGGLYSLALVALGPLVARVPARALVGQTLVVCGGALAALLAAAGWFISGPGILPVVLVNATGAAALALLAAMVHARLTRGRPAGALILAAAVLLLGLSGGRNVVVNRSSMMVLDAAAAVLACGVFLRPGPVEVPLGRVALALAVPLAAFVIRPLWETTRLSELGGFAIGLIWALRAIRPRLKHGSVSLLAAGLTAAVLVTALPTVASRQLLAALALAGLMLLDDDARRDPEAGPLERAVPGWVAGGIWLVLAATWARDLRLLDLGLGLPRGFHLPSLTWVGLFALPFALPAFALSKRRLDAAPPDLEPDPTSLPEGTAAEVLGWLVVVGALGAAIVPALLFGPGWVGVGVLAAAAAIAQAWGHVHVRPAPARLAIGHLLLVAAVWAAGVNSGRPILALAPLAVAAALAVTPLLGGRRTTGVVGLVLLPLLAAEGLIRHTDLWAQLQGLLTFGWIGPTTRLPAGVLAAAGAWLAVGAAGRRRRQAAAVALDPPPGQEAPPVPLDAPDAGRTLEVVAGVLLASATALALAPFPLVTAGSLALLVAITAIAVGWMPLGGSAWAVSAASALVVLDAWLGGRRLGSGSLALGAPAAALLLSLSPLAARRLPAVARQAGWVGFALFPLAVADILIAHRAPVVPLAALVAAFGLVHLIAPPQAPAWTRAAGPPAVLLAGYLSIAAFTGATWGTPPLSLDGLAVPLAAALAAFALWPALATGPWVVGLEALLGSTALLAISGSPAALLPLGLLAAGRRPLLARAAAVTLLVVGTIAAGLAPGRLPIEAAAAALAAGGAGLLRAIPPFTEFQTDVSALEVAFDRLRRVGPPALAAAVLVLLFGPRSGGTTWLPIDYAPAVAAAMFTVAAVWVRVRERPVFLVPQTVAGALLAAAVAMVLAFLAPPGSRANTLAAVPALVCLAAAVIAAGRLSEDPSTLIWGVAALGAPLAVVPLAGGLWHWPVALLAAGEVILLGIAARRRVSAILAAWTLGLGLLVAIWLAVAVLARLHPGGDPILHAGSVALGSVLAGALALGGGSGWLGAPAIFIRPFIHGCLWLGAAAALIAVGIGPLGNSLELAATLAALVAVAGLAAALGVKQATGSSWLITGAVLVIGYGCLRLRTSWLAWLAAGDGLVAVGAALLATLAERRLRQPQPGAPPGSAPPPPPDPRLPPDDFPVPLAPGEREMGWLAAALAGASATALLADGSPISWMGVGPLAGTLLLLSRARQRGPVYALAAAVLFNATIVVALTRLQVASYAAYAVPIGGSAALLVQVYRERLGFDVAVRAVPMLAVGGFCALQAFQTQAPLPAVLLGAVGLLMLPVSRLWRERSYLWIGLGCLVSAGAALLLVGPEHGASSVLARVSEANALRLLPVISLLVTLASALLLARSARRVDSPLEILHARVRDGLGLAAVTATAGLILSPVRGSIDVALALASVFATAMLALRLAPRLPASWPVLLAGIGAVGAYAYLRLRSGWMDDWQRWDGLMAVAAGLALALVERLLRRAAPAADEASPPPAEEDPERWPFGVAPVRILATSITCLSALAFLDRQAPDHVLAPLLAVLLFLVRARRGHPIHGVLAVVYLNATIALLLWDRNVSSAGAYALPLAASLTALLHIYRGHLGSDEAIVRTLPAVAAAGACVYDAVTTSVALGPTAGLAAIGLALLVLSRRWQVRPYLPVGLACMGAAVLTTITEWNARGWTASAVAIGAATLLVPAVLLRRR